MLTKKKVNNILQKSRSALAHSAQHGSDFPEEAGWEE